VAELNSAWSTGTLVNGTSAPYEQQAGLESEIAAAQVRVAAARHLATLRDTEIRAALRAELDASRAALAAMELEYETLISGLREEARVEVDRILAEARVRAAESVDGGSADVE
jgi:hypothetical protein